MKGIGKRCFPTCLAQVVFISSRGQFKLTLLTGAFIIKTPESLVKSNNRNKMGLCQRSRIRGQNTSWTHSGSLATDPHCSVLFLFPGDSLPLLDSRGDWNMAIVQAQSFR